MLIKIPVSVGELVDKITILEIKKKIIKDKKKIKKKKKKSIKIKKNL